jgi:hypothetical protein
MNLNHPLGLRARSGDLHDRALTILDRLALFPRWERFGRPVLVGSAAYDLMMKPDIDLEIFSPVPRIGDGFQVLSELAEIPGVIRVRFANELAGADMGLYWRVDYRDDRDERWKIDMWLLADDHPGPRSSDLVEPMLAALTTEHRIAILSLKERFRDRDSVKGIDIYQAVLDGGVRSAASFERWLADRGVAGLTHWRPRPSVT